MPLPERRKPMRRINLVEKKEARFVLDMASLSCLLETSADILRLLNIQDAVFASVKCLRDGFRLEIKI